MFAETVIGYIDLIEHKFPQRSYKRELNAALHLSLCFHLIDRAHDRSSRKRDLSEQIFRSTLWNNGEKIIGLIEEAVAKAAVKVQRDFRSSRSMPLTRDTFNDVIESVASKSLADENDTDRSVSELPTDPYTFELVSYEQGRKCLRVLSLIYGISGHKRALDQWRSEASIMSSLSVRLAQQYYDIDIDHCEFALIDPLLLESQAEEGIWALADLDCFTGRTGVAEKVLNAQKTLRKELINGLGDIFAKTEAEQARLIDEKIAQMALESLDRMSRPAVQILTPDNVPR